MVWGPGFYGFIDSVYGSGPDFGPILSGFGRVLSVVLYYFVFLPCGRRFGSNCLYFLQVPEFWAVCCFAFGFGWFLSGFVFCFFPCGRRFASPKSLISPQRGLESWAVLGVLVCFAFRF